MRPASRWWDFLIRPAFPGGVSSGVRSALQFDCERLLVVYLYIQEKYLFLSVCIYIHIALPRYSSRPRLAKDIGKETILNRKRESVMSGHRENRHGEKAHRSNGSIQVLNGCMGFEVNAGTCRVDTFA